MRQRAMKGATKSPKQTQEGRIAAVRNALTKYFLGIESITEQFWETANPSLRNKRPSEMAKSGKLKALEAYVTGLRKHARSIKVKYDERRDGEILVLDGSPNEICGKLNDVTSTNRVVAILFSDAEAYNTYAPVCRRCIEILLDILRRRRRTQQLLFARIDYSLAANLPIKVPKMMGRSAKR